MVDEKSGVSARMSNSGYENIFSAVKRRLLKNNETSGTARIADLYAMIPAITGKVELVYEGEQEGPYFVAMELIGQAIKDEFEEHIPHPSEVFDNNPSFIELRSWFSSGNIVRSEEHTSELQSRGHLVCRLLL